MEYVKAFKGAVTALTTILTTLWGVNGWLMAAWLILMLIDYITGTAAAYCTGTWQSSVAREGLWHKAGSIAAVLMTGILYLVLNMAADNIGMEFKLLEAIVPLVMTWYILTEAGSILENAGKLGAPMPPFLLKAVSALKGKAEELGNDE